MSFRGVTANEKWYNCRGASSNIEIPVQYSNLVRKTENQFKIFKNVIEICY